MKKILLIALGAVLFACTPKHDGYTITGTITGDDVQDAKVILSNFSRVEPIKDTVEMVAGKFTFKGKITTPEQYAITVEGMEGRITFFLENTAVEVTAQKGDFQNAVTVGGAVNDQLNQINKTSKEIGEQYKLDEITKEFYAQGTTEERKKEIYSLYEEAQAKIKALEEEYFAANPNSYYTVSKIIEKVEEKPIEEVEARVAEIEALPEFAGNRFVKDLRDAVNTLKGLQAGMPAPEFTLNDQEGNPVSLSSVYSQHKVTMIDFWAGWCGPCRRFNPTLVEIYKKYNKHGFGIIGVSLDSDENVWKSAINDDKLTWVQVSDLQYWNSAPAKLYYVRYIPQNLFVDAEGKIIQRKVENGKIEEFLKEQLGL